MARLFANSNEEDQVQDLNNVESAVAVDGPEDVKDDLQDPVEETALESYKDIKEAVEEALETQDEIQEQIENSEQVLESNPEGVTEEVIQDAQECLVASLSKLGLSRDQISKYRVSSESCKTNAERLQATIKKLRLAQETIRRSLKGAIAESYKVTDRKFGISQEYNAGDWPQILLGPINTIWRGLTNNSKTKIEAPGALVTVLTGKWTVVGQIIPLFNRFAGALSLNPLSLFDTAKFIIDTKDNKGFRTNNTQELNSLSCNIYKDLIVNYKKVTVDQLSMLENEFANFKTVIEGVKKNICKPCPQRDMSTTEIHDMKLFRPDKAAKEISAAKNYLKGVDPKLGKLADEVGEYVTKHIIQFIVNNTVRDV